MPHYIVNRNPQPGSRDHEVHNVSTCIRLPAVENRVSLGEHIHCSTAVVKAQMNGYPSADGCYYCCPDCHTS